LKEACALLLEHGDKARLFAGGTDLMIRMSRRASTPQYVIGLRGVKGLDHLRCDKEKGLVIGAMSRLSAAAGHSEIKRYYPALAASAALTATVQIRNMGTIVGNICNAAPSADNAPPLMVYAADVAVAHPGGERVIPLSEFFRGPGLTALEPGEVVRELRVPPPQPRSGSDYQKASARGKVDIAAVCVAAWVQLDDSGAISSARVCLGAVGPTPILARRAADMLIGQKPEADLIDRAAAQAADEASPISDVRASAAWRRHMVKVLTARAVNTGITAAERCEI
jgi:carbon-monoxide dehydrogenase medium subunit